MHSRHQKTHLWWCRLTAHSSLSVLGPLLDPAFSGPAGSRCFRRRQYTMAASTSASSATAKGRGGVVGFVNKRCAEQLEKRRTAAGIMLTHAAMQGCALKLQGSTQLGTGFHNAATLRPARTCSHCRADNGPNRDGRGCIGLGWITAFIGRSGARGWGCRRVPSQDANHGAVAAGNRTEIVPACHCVRREVIDRFGWHRVCAAPQGGVPQVSFALRVKCTGRGGVSCLPGWVQQAASNRPSRVSRSACGATPNQRTSDLGSKASQLPYPAIGGALLRGGAGVVDGSRNLVPALLPNLHLDGFKGGFEGVAVRVCHVDYGRAILVASQLPTRVVPAQEQAVQATADLSSGQRRSCTGRRTRPPSSALTMQPTTLACTSGVRTPDAHAACRAVPEHAQHECSHSAPSTSPALTPSTTALNQHPPRKCACRPR